LKILIIAPYCRMPNEGNESRFWKIAKMHVALGNNVTIVTSNFKHREKEHREKYTFASEGLEVKYIYESGYQKNISLKRMFSHTIFLIGLTLWLTRETRQNLKYDVVHIAVPFITAIWIVKRFGKKISRKIVADIQDVWPEAFGVSKINFFLPTAFLKKYNKKLYDMCDGVIGVSKTYINNLSLSNKSVPTEAVYLGVSDIRIFKRESNYVQANVNDDVIRFFYIGTIGSSYDLETVVRFFSAFTKIGDREIELHLFGSGPMEDYLKKISSNSVHYHGYLKWTEMMEKVNEFHIALNCIRSNGGQSITNKIADYILLDKPILSSQILPELDELLSAGPYVKYEAGNRDSLLEGVRRVIDLRGLKFNSSILERFDRDIEYKKILRLHSSL
jgi:glycosyltransferase involved in cell wall biosynthesis